VKVKTSKDFVLNCNHIAKYYIFDQIMQPWWAWDFLQKLQTNSKLLNE